MKIELEDVDSPKGCLLRLGDLSMMFNTRLEAQQFVDQLQGRIGAMKFGGVPGQKNEQGRSNLQPERGFSAGRGCT
ncbi:hypothetical protein LVW35_10725 [Pseudomonas sp. HN11]|uniref:hypothetical protein n=1 Tax=Pseudomonas sp. HN11 TaxID=1344094 RepID=UPI001F44C34B|nr:hypothetical protein [Pseudomonas sp. HN11]UII73608.1 hypothetical protein LVW35_10725 [Pseudomonas sp. HN11]